MVIFVLLLLKFNYFFFSQFFVNFCLLVEPVEIWNFFFDYFFSCMEFLTKSGDASNTTLAIK
jgi:hypothetical protein